MGTLLMRQASSFLQEKYRAARLALTDISEAELLCNVNWKKWRQSYNSLILLEFLITHGPEDFATEFRSDVNVIKELGTFCYTDQKGVNWGHYMRNKTERILQCMEGGSSLQEVRSKAIKLTNEIQGFGSSPSSISSPLSTSSPTSSSWRSSFHSNSPSSPTLWNDNTNYYQNYHGEMDKQPFDHHHQDYLEPNHSPKEMIFHHKLPKNFLGVIASDLLDWNSIEDTFTEIDLNDGEDPNKKKIGFFQGMCVKHVGYSPLKKDGDRKKNT
ncbi:epsin-3 isoform X2 [Spinacia oleracea]|uniref:Epsin-3 isoform X2 n=1 Tax=Spinacia oleracea TaxID=3562 RepID=A0ABM3RGA2_SPIOL|nr:epsin-3 isoform X2 [Spinacia oleracea]